MTASPDVAVVVTHYDDQRMLSLVLAALGLQTLAADRFEVVVADDGSPEPPELGERPYRVSLVRQEDRGFRASAARNLGAAATTAPLLCFLDGDTMPEPAYLAEVLAAAEVLGEGLLVGRRRHADLHGWDQAAVVAWLSGAGSAPVELTEPRWLQDGFSWTDDLRDADDESYRFVIGAVLSVHRSLLDRAGGWEERFDRYGGEDWEVANRCWLAGAAFRHVPTAVAWHDGVDFAERDVDRVAVQNHQALVLARLLPSPATRPPGLVWHYPQVVVEVDDRGWSAEQTLLCVASLLDGADAGVWLADGTGARDGLLGEDPRLHVGQVPPDVRRRCRAVVVVDRPVECGERLVDLVAAAPVDRAGIRVRHARAATVQGDGGGARVQVPGAEIEAGVALGGLLRARSES